MNRARQLVYLSCLLATVASGGPARAHAPRDAPGFGTRSAELQSARQIEAAIAAGDLDRARRVLRGRTFSPLVAATLQGRLALAQGDPARAQARFEAAMVLAPNHAPLRLLTAHALLARSQFRRVLAITEHADLPATDVGVALVRATAYDGLGRHAAAYDTLRRAAGAHRGQAALGRALVLLCVRHRRFVAARQWAQTLTPSQLGRDVALTVLQHSRGQRGAVALGQWIATGFPNDADVHAQLGFLQSAAGHERAAAESLGRAARLGADVAFEAAEHHRVAGDYRSALAANAQVRGPKKRAQQRFDILFESGAMARAIVAGRGLADRHGISPRRRYNLAYAHYALQQFADATTLARALRGTAQAARAQALLRAMGR